MAHTPKTAWRADDEAKLADDVDVKVKNSASKDEEDAEAVAMSLGSDDEVIPVMCLQLSPT
jgi:hypothetical protein